MLAGFAIALASYLPVFGGMDFGARLAVTAFGSGVIWISVMFLTKPESDETLDTFYRRVRPGGPGWTRARERTGLEPVTELRTDLARTLGAAMLLFGLMFTLGGAMLYEWRTAGLAAIVGVTGLLIMRRWNPAREVTQ
jgi:hypothetical protein